jgi:hypothetical protein
MDRSNDNYKKKELTLEPKKSLQLDLFTHFISNDEAGVTNTVTFWENIPKYFFTPEQIKNLRTSDGLAKPFSYSFSNDGVPCTVKFQPALMEQKDGNYKAFFPGLSEELVEEALKKIFTRQQFGIHQPEKNESWVKFTLGMVKRELDARGKTRSLSEIKKSIEIMSSCVMIVNIEGKEVWRGAILQDLVTVNREEYIVDTKALHAAKLPLFISLAINSLQYRQLNYARLMRLERQFARWFYKRLVHRFTQASFTQSYHCMFSDLQMNSGLLQQKDERHNRAKVLEALGEMKELGIISEFTTESKKEGNKVVDVKYTLYPTKEFIAEQKAANKRAREGLEIASSAGVLKNKDNFSKVIGTTVSKVEKS